MQTVSKAAIADIPQLCELLDILFSQEEEFQPNADKQAAALRRIIERPEVGMVLVLRDGLTLVGMVSVLFTISTACGGLVAMLEDLVIRPDKRKSGWGSLLLRAAREHAQQAGCLRITLLTDQSNTTARCFYERHGFVSSRMVPYRMML